MQALQAEYAARGLDRVADRFVLYRIVGNDLPPRHAIGSARANVAFILAHEPELADCERRWLLNRIADPAEEAALIALLERHGQTYTRIPFSLSEYAEMPWTLDQLPVRGGLLAIAIEGSRKQHPDCDLMVRMAKNNYAMNNNGARNAALLAGRAAAKWVLPWDGNCFLTATAWDALRAAVLARPYLKYFVVPMARLGDNAEILRPGFRPVAEDEPQILFRQDAAEMFDLGCPYGMRSKVSLFWRLGVPGPWSNWGRRPWERDHDDLAAEAGQFGVAGWVARLESGDAALEVGKNAMQQRGRARTSGIIGMLDALDERAMAARLDSRHLTLYRESALAALRGAGTDHPVAKQIRDDALAAMARGLHAVTDKTGCAPGGDRRDYWHPAPYWWPNPATPDGLPLIRRDGIRRPGTTLYEAGSEQYDRSRLQRVLEDSLRCALAWTITGDETFAAHGAQLLRRWFLDPAHGMTPHLRFAQVRAGRAGNQGTAPGVVEMRDLPLALDAARLLRRAGAFTAEDEVQFRAWLSAYLQWLLDSPQGRSACLARNNIGTFHDLQTAAIAAYLGDAATLVTTFRRCRERIQIQFDPDGKQPHELQRSRPLHYSCFNLQGWSSLARIGRGCGEDLWSYRSAAGHALRPAFDLVLGGGGEWPDGHADGFDRGRMAPLRRELEVAADPGIGIPDGLPPVFPSETGIRPYWFL